MMTAEKKKRRRGGVLYRVDPRRLAIKQCHTPEPKEWDQDPDATTTFENFSFEEVEIRAEVPDQIEIDQLPMFIDGIFFCDTEEEAQEYIRTQIGM